MIIADTGFWVGLFDHTDAAHPRCKQFLAQCREPLATTSPVLTETVHLLTQRRFHRVAQDFLRLLTDFQQRQFFELFNSHDLSRHLELMRQYADLPMDFADASLVILAEHLGHGRIVSTDRRDFHAYRWKNHQPFRNLLEPLE
ncbi:MAG: PIN domain-containing protein [Methylococcaceae bacterium]|nr:PIN domain-containing protein [Methylococcaceae bacterium]